jgi:N-acyl-D-aspartate/D-glutamate deacylase
MSLYDLIIGNGCIVDGHVAIRNGNYTGALAGRLLRKSR